jgi:anaerobic C4-dicarboxylate transporter
MPEEQKEKVEAGASKEKKEMKIDVKNPKTKKTLIIVLVAIILIAIIASYSWAVRTNNLLKQTQQELLVAQEIEQKALKYDTLMAALNGEYNRCQGFIAQGQGTSSEFDYCRSFMNWFDQNVR